MNNEINFEPQISNMLDESFSGIFGVTVIGIRRRRPKIKSGQLDITEQGEAIISVLPKNWKVKKDTTYSPKGSIKTAGRIKTNDILYGVRKCGNGVFGYGCYIEFEMDGNTYITLPISEIEFEKNYE